MFLTSFWGLDVLLRVLVPLLHLPPGDDKMIVLGTSLLKSRRIQSPPFLEQRYRRGGSLCFHRQEDLFSDFFAYRSMAKDVDASEETFVAPCLLPL
jgi:hypothetical protein